jgi:hypothetical protein
MSEIFNWLKRAEADKKEFPPEAPSLLQMIEATAEAPANQDKESIEVPILPHKSFDSPSGDMDPAHVKLGIQRSSEPYSRDREVHSTIALDPALVDCNIRDVWDPITFVGEQFRILRAKLSLIQRERGSKTLLITSAAPGEGKTFISCGIAGVLAQEPEKRILLVDADLRRPRTAKNLGMSNHDEARGLSDVLRGEIDVMDSLVSSEGANLFLLHQSC